MARLIVAGTIARRMALTLRLAQALEPWSFLKTKFRSGFRERRGGPFVFPRATNRVFPPSKGEANAHR